MTQTYSLRKRLFKGIGLPLGAAVLLILTIAYFSAWQEIDEVYDAQLVHSAKVLLQLTQHEILEDEGFHLGMENPNLEHKYETKIGFRIWEGGTIIAQSPNTLAFGKLEGLPGFSDQWVGKDKWRVFVYLDAENKIKIEVSEKYSIRFELILLLMGALLWPLLLLLPAIFAIVWYVVRLSLKPLEQISEDVDSRNIDDLSPLVPRTIPAEIAPLVSALDALLQRLGESFRHEREFTDHAAHELRTPLAAMKTQTQVLIKKAKDMPECQESLDNLLASIDRATHLVEQLLSLARLQNETFPMKAMNLTECLHDCIQDIRECAAQKHIIVTSDIADEVYINGHEDSLVILFGNLLENAIKYSPAGGAVKISLGSDGQVSVCDNGNGLTSEDKQQVFKRFVRADKTGQSGSGLGLSICEWIAAAHDTKVILHDNHPRGLNVILQFKPLN